MSRRTIQSPGVEIREIDLTQRPAAAVGTSVFIAGFSDQGPTDEIFNVGTFAEFQEIYGRPTNSAERYFYHSARQVFNSDANVFVSRIPYGASDGDRRYSALVYPVNALNTATITAFDSSTGSLCCNKSTFGMVSAKTAGVDSTHGAASGFSTGLVATSGAPAGSNISPIGSDLGVELIIKDANDNLNYISAKTNMYAAISGYSGSSSAVNTNSTMLSAIPSAFTNGSDFSVLTAAGTTLVAGEIFSKDAYNFGSMPFDGDDGTTTSLSTANYYVIGNPTLLELTETEYNAVKDGNITWSNNVSAGGDTAVGTSNTFTSSIVDLGKAGIIVLNKGATYINDNFEGYYTAISDSSHTNPATDYDAAGAYVYTATSTGDKTPSAYATVPTSRIDFSLSGSSTDEKSSVSKSLENISKWELGPEFVDTINLGIFKVRNTPFSNSEIELTQFLAEGYTGSLDSSRKVQDENGGAQKSIFIENVETGSPNIKVLVNPYISTKSGSWTAAGGAPSKFVRAIHTGSTNAGVLQAAVDDDSANRLRGHSNFAKEQGLFPLGVYSSATNDATNKNIGSIPDKLTRIFEIGSNIDVFQMDVTVEAGLGTVHALGQGTTFDDTTYVDVGDASAGTGFYTADPNMKGTTTQIAYRNDYRTIFNKFESFARETRKDHIFIADALRPLVVQGSAPGQKVLDDKSKNFSKHVYWPLRHQFGVANSNFATTYGNWAKVGDGTSGTQTWIPFSGVAAKIFAQNDAAYAPWYAPAGFNRGVVGGVNDIAISPTQRQRDQLYRIAINPVTQFPGEGIVIFGQKTLQRTPTAFDRINVRRLFLDLEKRTRETLKFFVFEPNTFLTRNKVVNTLTPMFENCKQTEGIYDYLIICDDRNNPASVIDQNELRVDIYLKPVRAAEFILVNFYAVNTDVSFQEIVGQ